MRRLWQSWLFTFYQYSCQFVPEFCRRPPKRVHARDLAKRTLLRMSDSSLHAEGGPFEGTGTTADSSAHLALLANADAGVPPAPPAYATSGSSESDEGGMALQGNNQDSMGHQAQPGGQVIPGQAGYYNGGLDAENGRTVEVVQPGRHCCAKVGNTILLCGPHPSAATFPFKCLVGPDWPCLICTYTLIIVPNVAALVWVYVARVACVRGCANLGAVLFPLDTAVSR